MWLDEIIPGSPEADELGRRILTALYKIAARDQGYELESVRIYKREETEVK